jgi:ligand-binding SRPBCC domain-containing protein
MSKTVEFRSFIPAPVDKVFAFHQDANALRQLTPPPTLIQVLRDNRASLTSGEIEFRLWMGPLPLRWVARHKPGPIPTSFVDEMIRGPLAHWTHTHLFEPAETGTRLVDRITFDHRPGLAGLLTRLAFDGLPLRLVFLYRHWRTRRAVRS